MRLYTLCVYAKAKRINHLYGVVVIALSLFLSSLSILFIVIFSFFLLRNSKTCHKNEIYVYDVYLEKKINLFNNYTKINLKKKFTKTIKKVLDPYVTIEATINII